MIPSPLQPISLVLKCQCGDRTEKAILEIETDMTDDISGSSYLITFKAGSPMDEVVKLGRRTRRKLHCLVLGKPGTGPQEGIRKVGR